MLLSIVVCAKKATRSGRCNTSRTAKKCIRGPAIPPDFFSLLFFATYSTSESIIVIISLLRNDATSEKMQSPIHSFKFLDFRPSKRFLCAFVTALLRQPSYTRASDEKNKNVIWILMMWGRWWWRKNTRKDQGCANGPWTVSWVILESQKVERKSLRASWSQIMTPTITGHRSGWHHIIKRKVTHDGHCASTQVQSLKTYLVGR